MSTGDVFLKGFGITTIGGYQVIKKWLSYRQRQILSRDLNIEEAREVTNIARRLTAIVLTYPFLDENYGLSKGKD